MLAVLEIIANYDWVREREKQRKRENVSVAKLG